MYFLSTSIARSELRKLAQGKKSRVPLPMLIDFTLRYCMTKSKPEPPLENDEVRWLERLYSLPDLR